VGNATRGASRQDARVSAARAARQPAALVHERIRQVARARPHLLAVHDGRRHPLTYEALDAAADALAYDLRTLGVRRGVRVGLCHERSAANVVGALATWKAGGAYVGLDPAYPTARLAYMLDDAAVDVVLSQRSVIYRLPSTGAVVVDLDAASASASASNASATATGHEEHDEHDGATTADDVAYVIYTSGSTGSPKGVEVSQANLVHLADWHCDAFGVGSNDRASVLASPAFDASVWEVWPALTAGASLHVVDADTAVAPRALRDWLVASGITISFVATPLAELLLELEWPRDCALRALLTGGDRLRRRPPPDLPFTLVNNYGVAEATVVSTSGVVHAGTEHGGPPTIGRAIARTPLYVLDGDGRRVPDGEAGDLHIGGAGVAIGYLGRPDLTAERFRPDPFANTPGARMYRTGDRVRITRGGEIEFLGRLDRQVQVRGQRVELDEVHVVLDAHPDVVRSAVVAREQECGDVRLVAYVVGTRCDPRELREHVARVLPAYMVPSAFVPVDALPTTANGKIDPDALPAPPPLAPARPVPSGGSPATDVVLSVLEELLELRGLDPDDNFFELGGHSLLGAQLIARLEDVFHVEVTHLALFDNPTAAGLAAVIEQEQVTP
jgi:amino acid adenylation domain-containing protein